MDSPKKVSIYKGLTSLVLGLSMVASLILPTNAHAWLLLGGRFNPSAPLAFIGAGFCLFLLPICLLDEKVAGQDSYRSISSDRLLDQGYTRGQIQVIMGDQERLVRALNDANAVLIIKKGDTITNLNAQIRNLVPTVSEAFIQYFDETAFGA